MKAIKPTHISFLLGSCFGAVLCLLFVMFMQTGELRVLSVALTRVGHQPIQKKVDSLASLAEEPEAQLPPASATDLLPAPKFAESMPEVFETTLEESLPIEWQAVEGAKRYRIIVRDAEGSRVKTRSTWLPAANVPKPTKPEGNTYWVSLAAMTDDGHEGAESERRKLLLIGVEPLAAPPIAVKEAPVRVPAAAPVQPAAETGPSVTQQTPSQTSPQTAPQAQPQGKPFRAPVIRVIRMEE
jgi:hypothetical protein